MEWSMRLAGHGRAPEECGWSLFSRPVLLVGPLLVVKAHEGVERALHGCPPKQKMATGDKTK